MQFPHLICGGFSVEENETHDRPQFFWVSTCVGIEGDARQFEDKFIPEPNGHKVCSRIGETNQQHESWGLPRLNIEKHPAPILYWHCNYPENILNRPIWTWTFNLRWKSQSQGQLHCNPNVFDNDNFFRQRRCAGRRASITHCARA